MPRAERSMVPDVTPTSYYGRPVIKPPTWRWPIPAYLFSGGLAAGTALAGGGARLLGDDDLAGRANLASLAAVGASTAFLIHDLGRPARFHHMLRVAKPTSPMSVGTWIFSAFSGASGVGGAATVARLAGIGPSGLLGPFAAGAQVAAALIAPALATYTGVLIADTAVPTWHEARHHLPWLFAASATASGGAMVSVLAAARRTPPGGPSTAERGHSPRPLGATGSAQVITVLAAAGELVVDRLMHRHLERVTTGDPEAPDLASPYRQGSVRTLSIAARAATASGATLVATSGRRRAQRALGGLAVVGGACLERFAVFHAGAASARHPSYTVGPQRARLVDGGDVA